MKYEYMLVAGAAALALSGAAVSAPAKKKAPVAASSPPVATYWMDVTTQSGFGAGMAAGGQPNMADIMAMMSGQGPSYSHGLRLRLASRTAAPAAPQAEHLIPPGLRMGASLPLVTPARAEPTPAVPVRPQGRILIYWGCGDRVSAGQPMVLDVPQLASGKVPESIRRVATTMGQTRHSYSGPTSAPGFGEWPNPRDSRTIPAGASLIGAHRVAGNYSPQIDFTLGSGQDFMGPMNLVDGGAAPSGASLVRWNPVTAATGYALALFGANEAGETIMWSNARNPGFANLDYLTPADAARAVGAGDALSPATTQCLLPAEVARAVPMGMVMGVAYGPEAHFAEAPKNPKWAVTVRYRSNGSLIRGMSGMMGGASAQPGQPGQPPRKRKKFGLGDILNGTIPGN